jgi:hypothetical protein
MQAATSSITAVNSALDSESEMGISSRFSSDIGLGAVSTALFSVWMLFVKVLNSSTLPTTEVGLEPRIKIFIARRINNTETMYAHFLLRRLRLPEYLRG